jgi:micrococcal nuclease
MKAELILALAVLISGCAQLPSEEKGDKAEITRVVDGDTVEAKVRNETVTIRFQGVDTPEVHAENTPEDWECNLSSQHLREYGKKASEFVKENYSNTKARIIYKGKGVYGRTIASLYVNGTSLEKQLLRKGLAQTYESTDFEKKSRYQQIESKIRRKEIGVWSGC